MISEARKLHLIEEVLKIKSDKLLQDIETLINKTKSKEKKQSRTSSAFQEFSGIWTEDEADEIARVIEESCEAINPDDWK
ncbi:MAG TPA: hypothetical protein VN040_01795 [Pseudosphingobacterium sp.]|nr:hypothetical protein [Pseudosphingobacterium sp.]